MQKGSAQLLLILAAVFIVFGGVVFYFKTKNNLPITIPIAPKKQVNIKDYKSTNLGFEFKFAKDLKAVEDSEEEYNKRNLGDFRKNFKGYVGYEPGKFLGAVVVLNETGSFDENPFTVWVFDNSLQLSPEEWFEKYWYYPFVWGVFDYTSKGHIALDQEATIGGILAKAKVIDYQPGSPKFIYMAKDKKMYLFRIIKVEGEQILSSFKLLSADSAGKTYICPENGWENCMPILSPEAQIQCSKEAIEWKKDNCPNFQGVAQ